MTDDATIILGLYLKGDHITRDVVTEALGIEPSDFRKKGKRSFSTEQVARDYVQKTSVWSLVLRREGGSISDSLSELHAMLASKKQVIATISGVEIAYLDALISLPMQSADALSYQFELSTLDLCKLTDIGVPFQCTIMFTRE